MTERMQTVNEGEVESGLRPQDQQKGLAGESLPAQQGEQGRFTNVGGSSVAPQQQQSSLQQQQQPLQGSQQSLGTSQGQTPLTGQMSSQGTGQQQSFIPQQQGAGGQHQMGGQQGIGQHQMGGQQGIGQQGMQQGVGQQGLGQQGLGQQGVPVGQQQMGQQQVGQQQIGQQPIGQQPIGQQGQQVPMQNLAQQQPVATFAEVTIDDPLYEPQARIANMLDNHKRAFLRPYNLVSFNNQPIMRDDPTGVLYTLDQLRGVRIVCFPITKGAQGPIMAASSSTSATPGMTGPSGGQLGGAGAAAPGSATAGPEHRPMGVALEDKASVIGTNIVHPMESHHARQAQRQQGVQKMGTDTTTGATGVQGVQQPHQDAVKYRKGLLVTDMNLEIEPTSQVWGIDVPEDVTPNFWENKSARIMGPVNLGRLLTLNVSQIPSAANRALTSNIDKPTRHLFIFGETSRSPVLIVERDLKPVRKCIRVFSKDLNVLCKIEGFTSLLRKKIIITGPDEETPIYTVKQKGLLNLKNFPGLKDSQDETNYIVFGAYKKPMGCITSRYIAPSTLPVPVTEGASLPMAYDVFFPQNAMWANKAALMVTALYFDYLWSE